MEKINETKTKLEKLMIYNLISGIFSIIFSILIYFSVLSFGLSYAEVSNIFNALFNVELLLVSLPFLILGILLIFSSIGLKNYKEWGRKCAIFSEFILLIIIFILFFIGGGIFFVESFETVLIDLKYGGPTPASNLIFLGIFLIIALIVGILLLLRQIKWIKFLMQKEVKEYF